MSALWSLLRRLLRLAPTQPEKPDDERDESGADPEYGPELAALARSEKEMADLAAELDIDLLDPEQRSMAEDILLLRLVVAEDIDHFGQRIGRLLDDWQPGWFEDQPTTALPTFDAVHCLIDDTAEFAAVAG